MLEELAKKNSKWISIAFNICKDKDLSKDIVQEMYLKIYNISQKKELKIKDNYVIKTMVNIFKDYCKENKKKVSIENIKELEDNQIVFNPTDREKYILDNLTFLEKEILIAKQTKSYHEIQREYNINYQFARRVVLQTQNKYGKKKKS